MNRLPDRQTSVLLVGAGVAAAAFAYRASTAAAAASQSWGAFALVGGLLLIGLVAAEDGLFASAGSWLAGVSRSGWSLYLGVVVLVLGVTAVLNLDTSVAFLTPLVASTARRRGGPTEVLLASCLLLSNAGSLLLPGSNLTNLIVLGHLHLAGARFVGRMALPWLVASSATALVVGLVGRPHLMIQEQAAAPGRSAVVGVGLASVVAAAACVLAMASPGLPVLVIGAAAAAWRAWRGHLSGEQVREVLGLPVLVGLFGLAVGLGGLGRDWSGPARLLGHLDSWGTAGLAAVVSVAVNNLPAAALLSARVPRHPFSLLIGLNVGPNLFPSGSLAWLLWIRVARQAGEAPPIARTVRLGLLSAPLALSAAVGVLLLTRSP